MKNSLTIILILISCLYSIGQINEDWEDNTWIGNWTMSNGIWEVGTHSSDSNPIFGNYCIGTIFGGNYPDDTESILISPSFQVPDTSQNLYLRFWQWYSFSWNDNGTVMIKPDGGDWQPISDPYIWNSSNTWSSPLINLSEFAGMTVQIGFSFYSNNHGSISNDVSSGWYIDNIELVTGEVVLDSLETFENGIGHWSFEGAWALGQPTSGPNEAHSGDNCFATNLAGNYGEPPSWPSAIVNLLISPSFQVPDISQNPYLRFWQWYSFSWNDNGTVMIKPDGGDWQPLADPYIWNSSNTWSSPLISLGEFAGMTVQIGFSFYSNNHSSISNDVSSGWYIDDVQLITGTVIFNSPEDFESGMGHWSAEGAWGLGQPTSGSNEAHSGDNCFATNLAGNYGEPPSWPSAIDDLLISPPFQIPDTAHFPRLGFWHWFNFSYNDYGEVLIKTQGGGWDTIMGPFTGTSEGLWRRPFFDLSPYAGETIQIAFHFHSQNHSSIPNDVSSGWYIDDFFAQDFLSLLPPAIGISKTGTTPVPGRKMDYFITVYNDGETTSDSIVVYEVLDPDQFVYIYSDPLSNYDSTEIDSSSLIAWVLPPIQPEEFITIQYKVLLNPSVSIGSTIIGGPACVGMNYQKFKDCLWNAAIFTGTCTLCAVSCGTFLPSCVYATTGFGAVICIFKIQRCISCLKNNTCVVNWNKIKDCYSNSGNCSKSEQIAVGPQDPNEKMVIAERYIKSSQRLVYPIHFENKGTIEAIDVFVTDTLDANLDFSTLEILTQTQNAVTIDTINRIIKGCGSILM